jgi:hypothetical protein
MPLDAKRFRHVAVAIHAEGTGVRQPDHEVGNDPPTDTAFSVRVTLDKIGGGWLISAFEPV